MRFWDSSALVPLVAKEPASEAMQELYDADSHVVVWWSTEIECASALARKEREAAPTAVADAFRRLDALTEAWEEVEPVQVVRAAARRLVRVHDLRAADAPQLAAAIAVAEAATETLALVTLDDRLAAAAVREGFTVLG